MGKMSAGTYLRVIRERRDLSRSDIAKRLRTSVQTVANIENGDKEPGVSKLLAFVDMIGANLDDVRRLMLASEDETEAYRLADLRLAEYANQQAGDFTRRVGQDRADAIARRLAADPDFVNAIRRIAEQMDE
jgi:transcriptional regulator with XRE-family HTH domain